MIFTAMFFCMAAVFPQTVTLNYQAVVRNGNNHLVQDSTFSVDVSISVGGNVAYTESRNVTTNRNGVVSFAIGDAGRTAHSGTELADITGWNGASIAVTFHLAGGDVTTDMPVATIPYALEAGNIITTVAGLSDAADYAKVSMVRDTLGYYTPTADLATVATSGSYNDLTNKPTIPAAQVQSDWNATSGMAQIKNKPTLATVATSGSYNDLTNKPTIPTVNNATLTVAVEGGTTTTFTANSSSNATVNLAKVAGTGSYNDLSNKPTAVSTFTNDAGYITAASIPDAQVNSDWNATSGKAQILNKPTNVSTFANDAGYFTEAYFNPYVDSLEQAFQDKIDSLGSLIEEAASVCDTLPTVVTSDVSEIGAYSATVIGTVRFNGGAKVTQYGFDWGTDPDLNTFTTTFVDMEGEENNIFQAEIQGLNNGTRYYVRAFAINRKGLAKGSILNFVTAGNETVALQSCPNASTVKDKDGNVYNTVLIGNQCWMRENLRVTHAGDREIPIGTSANANSGFRYYPHNNPDLVEKYGYLYNWIAVTQDEVGNASPSEVPGICPCGWHVPSDDEWVTLGNYISSQFSGVAQALSDKSGWASSTVEGSPGKNPSQNNSSGFSALPTGWYDGTYDHYGNYCFFWNASKKSCRMTYNSAALTTSLTTSTYSLAHAFSVRCVKTEVVESQEEIDKKPKITSTNITNIEYNKATVNANVTLTSEYPVTNKGICWSSTQTKPSINSDHTTAGSGEGSFSSVLNNLEPGTVYYVRAYATNSRGTTYSPTLSFTTFEDAVAAGQVCPGITTVKDTDNNVYNTVYIGGQCWTRENMRATHFSSDGSSVTVEGSHYSATVAYCYPPDNKPYLVPKYGYLYNWYAATKNQKSSSNPSGVQGICPNGWHVPSDAEWDVLFNNASLNCNGVSGNVADALSATFGWNSSSTVCTPGHEMEYNNSAGFSALPSGWNSTSSDGRYRYYGMYGVYWSTNLNDAETRCSYYRVAYNASTITHVYSGDSPTKTRGISVRCLRD